MINSFLSHLLQKSFLHFLHFKSTSHNLSFIWQSCWYSSNIGGFIYIC